MRTLFFLVILLAFLAAGCSENTESPVAPKSQTSLSKVVITEFTVKDYPIGLIDPGVFKVENGIIVGKKMIVAERCETDNPLMTGNAVNTGNLVYDFSTGKGTIWGTYVITPDKDVGGGKWENDCKGEIVQTGTSEWTSYIHGTGRGVGGTIDGMQYSLELVIIAWDMPCTYWVGTGHGIIKSHTL